MQHQQQMPVPEREDVPRRVHQVLRAHVRDAQGRVERADEERCNEGEELHALSCLTTPHPPSAPSPLTEGRRLSRHTSIESLLPAHGEKVPKADEGYSIQGESIHWGGVYRGHVRIRAWERSFRPLWAGTGSFRSSVRAGWARSTWPTTRSWAGASPSRSCPRL